MTLVSMGVCIAIAIVSFIIGVCIGFLMMCGLAEKLYNNKSEV